MADAIQVYASMIEVALPYAVAFSFGNLIVTSFLKMAFGGKVEF